MEFHVEELYPEYHFVITGASYAGCPEDNTMMYVSRKVEYLTEKLAGHKNCLIFLENGIIVDDSIVENNGVVYTDNPQLAYAKCAGILAEKIKDEDRRRGYALTGDGYYIGKNVIVGENSYIEPGVLLDHDVVIGKNARILSGAKIRRAVIGDNFQCNENAVVGSSSYTMAEDDAGNKLRIPSLGRVIIGNNVEIGAGNVISRGACGDTVIEDYVKLAELVHIGHESHLHTNVQVTAGGIIAGFVEIEENSFLGINSSVRNRRHIGEGCVVGMGAAVVKSVDDHTTVTGIPARKRL